jgi:transposase
MSNHLKMEQILAIEDLLEAGWSQRRIAARLGIHRNTVRRYARSKCTISQTGSEGSDGAKCTISQTGTLGRRSDCEPYLERIEEKYRLGLSIERIHQDLCLEEGFSGSYHSVWRFIKSQGWEEGSRVFRMECEPGEEAQIDYGTMYLLESDKGRDRKVQLLLVTLSHSRKAYAEAMLSQNTESFLRGLENAFRFFGGAPRRLCPDNLAAAVKKADWYDPEINPKLRCFARHYSTVVMPARPYQPTDKGKVESGIKYLKDNALKGRRFQSLEAINEHLRWWTEKVAQQRIHGTTKRQVQAHFEEVEKEALKPLPPTLFPCFQEARRKVHRDSYVEVARAYYQVPEEHIGREVWVRWDAKMIRVFDTHMRQVATHHRIEAGGFSHALGVGGCPKSVEDSVRYYRKRLADLGRPVAAWADGAIAENPDGAVRKMQGMLRLFQEYPADTFLQAAGKAVLHGQYSLRAFRNWLQNPAQQETFAFLENHELIRQPGHYTELTGTGDLFEN